MRLATFSIEGKRKIGLVVDQSIISLTDRIPHLPGDMIGLISAWDTLLASIAALRGEPDFLLSEVELLAPVPRPGKILAIGLNYADHVAESGRPGPEEQMWFSKAVTAVNGPFDPIFLPLVSEQLDYEAELVFVVGRRCRHASHDEAKAAIFGFCVGNDVSVRDWQWRTGQFMIGKSFDSHAPFGPWIVTADEVDPGNLAICLHVNGEQRQSSNTKHLIFDCAAQIVHLSKAMTLEPGDVIFTGTPGGVAAAAKPPQWLSTGDRVRVEIDGIGAIENEVHAEL